MAPVAGVNSTMGLAAAVAVRMRTERAMTVEDTLSFILSVSGCSITFFPIASGVCRGIGTIVVISPWFFQMIFPPCGGTVGISGFLMPVARPGSVRRDVGQAVCGKVVDGDVISWYSRA